jgi:LysR family transcriptional regulator, nod-box dependent transcriptional activator
LRLRGLDLNLLIVLDVVLEERSVARASERLNMSQPAVSSALGRLRQHFGDELMVMKGRQLTPTPFACTLVDPIRDNLARLRKLAAASPSFDPATSERVFTAVASEGLATFTLNGLAKRLAGQKRGISIRWLNNTEANFKLFERGGADVLILRAADYTIRFLSRPLFEETFCCVAWSGNSRVQGRVTLDDYREMQHVLIDLSDPRVTTPPDEALRALNIARHSAITLSSYGLAPTVIVGTDLLATVPLALGRTMGQWLPLQVLPTPFASKPFIQSAHWHDYADSDAGLHWLLDELDAAVRLDAPSA